MKHSCPSSISQRQLGFTLVELMVALLISVFLLGGLLTLLGGMKRTSGVQTGLDQLHDGERVAMGIVTDVIQSTGYFPITTTNVNTTSLVTALPAVGSWAAGQSILGTKAGTTAAPNDTISVRYVTSGADGVINCLGATAATPTTWINTFSVDGNGNLQCVLTTNGVAAAAVTLVNGLNSNNVNSSGVKYVRFLYGMQTNTASANTSIDAYVTADLVTDWSKVMSVQAVLYFVNPLYPQPGQTNQYFQVTRTIAVMNRAGVA